MVALKGLMKDLERKNFRFEKIYETTLKRRPIAPIQLEK